MAEVSNIKVDKAIANGDVDSLIAIARKGNAKACRSLYKWYRSSNYVESDEAVSAAFGMYYILFSTSAELDKNLVREITDYISQISDGSRQKVINWTKNARFNDDTVFYRDILDPNSMIENARNLAELTENRDYDKAIFYYETAAKSGNTKAKGELGQFYFFGIGNERHEKDPLMLSYLIEAANEDDGRAAALLFECYQNGIATAKDKNRAIYYLLKSRGIADDSKRNYYIENDQLDKLFQDVNNSRSIPELTKKDILAAMYYYGYGVEENSTRAVKNRFDVLMALSKPVFTNKIPEMYGTQRKCLAYKLSEEILRAGIELERSGRDTKTPEAQRTVCLDMAKKYYIASLGECPRAAVYLLRLMMEDKDPDFLPFAAMITKYWSPNCEDSKKAINMAYYMLGLYYEYYYSEFKDNNKYSDFIMGSNVGINNQWIASFVTKKQDIEKAKACYSSAMMIDDAARRYGMLIDFK